MRTLAACVALLATGLVHGSGAGQTPQPSQPAFRTGVDAVRLDVSVLDKNRRPVRGLTSADFTVLEDGKPQPIVTFSEVVIPDAGAVPAAWMREVGSDVATNVLDTRRIVVIVMDDGMTDSDPGTSKTAKEIARNVIERLGPNDLAAVVFTFMGRNQNFTQDRRQLIAAVETFVPKFSAPPNPMSAAASPNPVSAVASPAGSDVRRAGTPLGCYFQGRRGCLTDTLQRVPKALQDTPPGRKTIVLISAGVAYDFSMKNLEAGDDIDDLRETFQHLQRANVNVYTFDPRGLTMEGISSPKLDSSRTFAESTGGRAVLGTNAPWEHVDQVFQENSSYYLLGIQPTNTASDGRFRRLTVRANHPDVEVRTRSGYFAASNEKPGSKPAPPVTALDKAFGAALPTGNLPLSLTVAPFPVPGRKQSALAIVVGTERRVSNQPTTETLEVIATAFDTDVRARATHRQTVELSLEPGMGGQGRFDLYSRLMLSPGRYEVRVGAQGPRGAGGVFTSVDVPDFTKSGLTLSGLVLGRPRPDEDRSSDVLADLIPVKPLHKRSFSEAERVYAFLRVNQGGKDPLVPVSITSRIVDSATRDVFSDTTTLEAERFRSHRVADYRLELPLARLGAGQYLLTIEVPASKKPLRRDVRFTVK